VRVLTASGELKVETGYGFLALVGVLAAMSLPIHKFGGHDDRPLCSHRNAPALQRSRHLTRSSGET